MRDPLRILSNQLLALRDIYNSMDHPVFSFPELDRTLKFFDNKKLDYYSEHFGGHEAHIRALLSLPSFNSPPESCGRYAIPKKLTHVTLGDSISLVRWLSDPSNNNKKPHTDSEVKNQFNSPFIVYYARELAALKNKSENAWQFVSAYHWQLTASYDEISNKEFLAIKSAPTDIKPFNSKSYRNRILLTIGVAGFGTVAGLSNLLIPLCNTGFMMQTSLATPLISVGAIILVAALIATYTLAKNSHQLSKNAIEKRFFAKYLEVYQNVGPNTKETDAFLDTLRSKT